MRESFGYLVPAGNHRLEETIQRSRFVTTLGRAKSAHDAQGFVAEIRRQYPDATHHCWAFVAGPPGSSISVGMSDDGEPHGSAGRPMLLVLSHGKVGEVVAVVTRYYGGTKLGTGGLARAYSRGVALALESLPVLEKVEMLPVGIKVPYSAVDSFERLRESCGIEVLSRSYGSDIDYCCSVPAKNREAFELALSEITRGEATVSPLDGDS